MTMLGILGIDLGRGDQTARLYRCDCCGWTPRPVARMLRNIALLCGRCIAGSGGRCCDARQATFDSVPGLDARDMGWKNRG